MEKKSELQKMLDGELYQAGDPELVHMRDNARLLLSRYNAMMGASLEERNMVLKELLGKCSTIDIQPPFFCDYGAHISVGENFFMNFNCVILDCAQVTIGNNVMCGPFVQIYTAYHPVIASERIKGPELASPITIGDNVWLGGGAIICPGVTIGSNTTIGAGSVVTKDIPANVFAAGNPCKVIRSLA
ncbi:sugar O-acetyltransferase [Rufibacter hautae]|uniref:Acetyltransferase n=1 Tax=Rufibacter hautae TaxID=2595005 RepID=A0A5B6TIF1_9BACT|nr:sugar O-acetyltransferase [Rufibacter hautae]KAA3439227.1 sugar O-acetyltransferase [Rufibacter hautae]